MDQKFEVIVSTLWAESRCVGTW